MSNSILLPPARRSTRVKLAAIEHHQTEVIARLRIMGEDRLADRLERCRDARRQRQPGSWPWRCRLAGGCYSCRRTETRKWWRGFLKWLSGPETSLVTIPLTATATADLIPTMRRLRKGLRDVRDRAHRADPLYGWSAVAMAGTASNDHLMLLIQHPGIERDTLWSMLERRWPMVVVRPVGTVEPRSEFTVGTTVQLAGQHRGIEPVRVVIPSQRRAHEHVEFDEPIPMLV